MRIVLVFVEPPLPFGNAAARWYYVLLKGLTERGHHITAFSTCSNSSDIAAVADLFHKTDYDVRCFATDTRTSLMKRAGRLSQPMSYLFGDDFRAAFANHLASAEYHVLHLEQQWSLWIAPADLSKALVNVQYLFAVDREVGQSRDLSSRINMARFVEAESRLLRRCQHITAYSERLSRVLSTINPTAHQYVVPLGLDLSLYDFQLGSSTERRPTLGLIGSFTWGPTLEAARRLVRLWPVIRRAVPDARLLLVGRGADRLGERLHDCDLSDAEIHSDVRDTQPFFKQLDVLLYAPPAGSGMKVKVLEAFALGTPVVTNAEGVEGLPARDGVHAGIAGSDDELVTRVVSLLQHPTERLAYAREARTLLERHCDKQVVLDGIERVYRTMSANSVASLRH